MGIEIDEMEEKIKNLRTLSSSLRSMYEDQKKLSGRYENRVPLLRLRSELKKTQAQVGKYARVEQSVVSRYETGKFVSDDDSDKLENWFVNNYKQTIQEPFQ